jgi:tetratricopeptide (TPR) repeat protein
MRSTIRAAATWLILTSCGEALHAQDWPIPQDPQKAKLARSEHLTWTRRTLAGAYDKVGKKDPRWDEQVNELMKLAVPDFALRENHGNYDDVHQAAKRAIDAGCDDPMVLYIYAQSSFGRNHPGTAELEQRYAKAAKAFAESKYPAIRRASAPIRVGLYGMYRTGWFVQAGPLRYLDDALALFPESFKTDSITPSMRRVWRSELRLMQESMTFLKGNSKAAFDKIDAVLATVPAAKGIRLYFQGTFYIDYAWEARGSGFANTVTEVGWQKFKERTTVARKALEEAWNLDKTDSQSAAAMIEVELAIGEGNRDEMEKWFWRAMDADNDNLDACNKKLRWLEPKWHGSPEDLLEFARTCRDTKNWSSGIPLLLAEAHHRLAGYLPEAKRFEYMSDPDVWREIHGVYLDYLKNVPEDLVARSEYADFCYLCGQYKEGHEQFQKLGDQLAQGDRFSMVTLAEIKHATGEKVIGDVKPGTFPAKGFGVLYANYGALEKWADVTKQMRLDVANDRLSRTTAGLPDPIDGITKGLVIVYSVDGKIGLSTSGENQRVSLPPDALAAAKLSAVPAQGFAVLAAAYGVTGSWVDVTETFRERIANGKLEASTAGLRDPAPGIPKELVIAYARDGEVLLSISPESRTVSLPLVEPAGAH